VAEWHLHALEERLLRRGWDVEEIPKPDNVQIAASWRIERRGHPVILDFFGFDDLETFPIERAYAVSVRHQDDQTVPPSIGFPRRKPTELQAKRSWEQELEAFVSKLDHR
jgi:hypothetical protein